MNRAPHFILVDCAGADRKLAFGLSWQVLIGSDVAGLARARGRRLRATHLVVGGSPATVAGYGRTLSSWRRGSPATASRRRHTPHIQAAAQLYALRYPEGGMCLVPLPEGRYWLAAAQDGSVLSQADKVFASHRDALDAHARLREQRPALPEHDADAVWAALQQAVQPGARLAALPSRWAAMPLALRLFLICVALSAALPPLWNGLSTWIFSRNPEMLDHATAEPVDPYLAMLEATPTHAPADLLRLLGAVGKLPIQVQGWALRHAQCDAGPRAWNCSARYTRAHPFATNQLLHARLPPGWHVSFKPLDEATLSWRVASDAVSLARLALPSALRMDTELVAALQRLQPAFASVALDPAVALPLPPSLTTESPAFPAPVPPAIRRRALRMAGPLRSFALLPGPLPAVRWSRLTLDVQPQRQPSLVASTLVAELHGELYEQE
ncbi:hypothetical protein [Achromobacter marplatensis]|uniref:Type 4b pilus protein PilO2 n=1 Tax=Achromobacter marplatensis TaxID=470868 RepID=A0ABX9G910_9BURK|nr:hypothetical protein [Achromobacter marplatensis]RBP15690.1 hypothetical protein DFP87_11357 [Achromobacter marplatensis]CAB3698167.1 hypothetical protein LMG26219_05196 [Achromobacter marplatensis]